jgi:hypothetical protein
MRNKDQNASSANPQVPENPVPHPAVAPGSGVTPPRRTPLIVTMRIKRKGYSDEEIRLDGEGEDGWN